MTILQATLRDSVNNLPELRRQLSGELQCTPEFVHIRASRAKQAANSQTVLLMMPLRCATAFFWRLLESSAMFDRLHLLNIAPVGQLFMATAFPEGGIGTLAINVIPSLRSSRSPSPSAGEEPSSVNTNLDQYIHDEIFFNVKFCDKCMTSCLAVVPQAHTWRH